MMIFSADISLFMMIDISFFMIISLALVFMRTFWCRCQLVVVVVKETAPEKVLLQLSGIRVNPAHEFA